MIVSIIFYAISLIALGYTIYINYSWYKDCNELNDRWAERCDELSKRCDDICQNCKRCKNLREEKKK